MVISKRSLGHMTYHMMWIDQWTQVILITWHLWPFNFSTSLPKLLYFSTSQLLYLNFSTSLPQILITWHVTWCGLTNEHRLYAHVDWPTQVILSCDWIKPKWPQMVHNITIFMWLIKACRMAPGLTPRMLGGQSLAPSIPVGRPLTPRMLGGWPLTPEMLGGQSLAPSIPVGRPLTPRMLGGWPQTPEIVWSRS